MRISLNGRMSIEADDILVEENRLGGARARLAFAVLVLERPRPVDRFHLAEVLWPNALPASWEAALRVVMSRVRAFLGAAGLPATDVLTSSHGCYQLSLPGDVVVDVEAAAAAVDAAEAAWADGDLQLALAAASEVRDITARPFIAGAEGEWLDAARRRQRALRVRALDVLARSSIRLGDAARAVDAAQELLSLDPYRDASHVLIMEVHRAAGNRAQALRAYGWCRHVLAEELGVDPAPETEALYRSLLREEHGRGTGREVAWATSGVAQPPNNLPAQLTSFVGRGRELREVRQLLEGDRLVTLTGPAGSGKTRLALEVAGRSLAAHTGGTWFVDLAPLGDGAPVARAVAAAVGVVEPQPTTLVDTLIDHLRPREAILVHRQLRARPRGHLHPGRRPPAGLPPPVGAGHQPPAPRRARARSCGGSRPCPPRSRDRRPPSRRCWSTRGPGCSSTAAGRWWPTACSPTPTRPPWPRSAAASTATPSASSWPRRASAPSTWSRSRPASTTASDCSPSAPAPAMPATRASSGRWSGATTCSRPATRPSCGGCRCSPAASPWRRRRRSAALGGGDLQPVPSSDVLDLLIGLVNCSLVSSQTSGGQARFGLLETIRHFARDRLVESGEEGAVRHAHLAWCLSLVARAEPELSGPDQEAWFERIDGEIENLRSALGVGVRPGSGRRRPAPGRPPHPLLARPGLLPGGPAVDGGGPGHRDRRRRPWSGPRPCGVSASWPPTWATPPPPSRRSRRPWPWPGPRGRRSRRPGR